MNQSTVQRARLKFTAKMAAYKEITGFKNADIAKDLGVSLQTVQHMLDDPMKYRPSGDLILILLEEYEELKKLKGIDAL